MDCVAAHTALIFRRNRCTIVLMKIIADTSVFMAVVLNEPEKGSIVRLTKGNVLVAPEVLPYEICNALSAMGKRKRLARKEQSDAWKMAQRIPVTLRSVDMQQSLEIAIKHNICAYDAFFLECAANSRSPLLTLDRAMQRIADNMGITVLELK